MTLKIKTTSKANAAKSGAAAKKLPPEPSASSVSALIDRVVGLGPDATRVRVFRGHAKRTYELKPSLLRDIKHAKNEKNVLRELISLHPGEFATDRSSFEHLVRMQHYQLETRLLDVSYNPLVALYFAAKSYPDHDGDLLIFSVEQRRIKYYDSDAVSCIANLSNMKPSERNALRRIVDGAKLNRSPEGKRLLQFIKAEKPYFLPIIEPSDLSSIVLVKAKQNNKRIIAQQGAFFLFGLTSELIPGEFGITVKKVKIPKAAKGPVLRELDLLNINESTMYPEIEYAAKYLTKKMTPVQDETT